MKKRTNIVLGIIAVALICLGIFTKWSEKISIGIIGGADGPTSIIVSEMKKEESLPVAEATAVETSETIEEESVLFIEVYPLDRIVLAGKSIYLGMEQSEVESVIGKGELIGKRCYYYGNELAIDYDENSRVEFIEFLGGIGVRI